MGGAALVWWWHGARLQAAMFHESRMYVAMRRVLRVSNLSPDTRVMLAGAQGDTDEEPNEERALDDAMCAMEEMVAQDYSCLMTQGHTHARSG